jgi:hypothetical protein
MLPATIVNEMIRLTQSRPSCTKTLSLAGVSNDFTSIVDIRYFLQMEPNGDLYPCVLHLGTFQPKNAIKDGVEEAWKHAQKHSCFSCYNTWLNENRANL